MSTPAAGVESIGTIWEGRRRQGLDIRNSSSDLVLSSVVPDIPDFCRELVAALAEE